MVAPVWQRVKAQVRERSIGRCEVTLSTLEYLDLFDRGVIEVERFSMRFGDDRWRCMDPARDGHHILKPRRAHNAPKWVLDVCRACHEWFDAWHGESRGRLIAVAAEGGGTPRTSIKRTGKWRPGEGECSTNPSPGSNGAGRP